MFFSGLSTTYAIRLLSSEITHWKTWMSKNNSSGLLSFRRPQPQAVQIYPASNFSPGSGRHAGKTDEPVTQGHEFYWLVFERPPPKSFFSQLAFLKTKKCCYFCGIWKINLAFDHLSVPPLCSVLERKKKARSATSFSPGLAIWLKLSCCHDLNCHQ